MNSIRRVTLAAVATLLLASSAGADAIDNVDVTEVDVPLPPELGAATIEEYTDFFTWMYEVSDVLCENRYAELGAGVLVTTQYLGVGANYTDGNDVTLAFGSSSDGMILNGLGRINVTFSLLQRAVGVNYPGAVRIVGYLGNDVVFTSSDFGGMGGPFFAGIISSLQFDRVEIIDWFDDAVFIDDLFYENCSPISVEGSSWGGVKELYR